MKRQRQSSSISSHHRTVVYYDGSSTCCSLLGCFPVTSRRFMLGTILVLHAMFRGGGIAMVGASAPSSLFGGTTKASPAPASTTKSNNLRVRTRLTGYGSRANYKSIFHPKHLKSRHDSNNHSNNSSTTLWVQRRIMDKRRERSDGQAQLWFRCAADAVNHTSTTTEKHNHNASTAPICFSVLSLPPSHHHHHPYEWSDVLRNDSSARDNYNIQTCDDHKLPHRQWTPLEGIYGVYLLPSGLLWVLITETEPVYDVSPILNIRRVVSMELVHQAFPSSRSPVFVPQQQQQKEEARQLQLLRQALKEHEFYFVPSQSSTLDSTIVPDMTRTLQRSFDMYQSQQQLMNEESHSYHTGMIPRPRTWWNRTSNDTEDEFHNYPDSRFFWNEVAVYPLLHALQHQLEVSSTDDADNVTDPSTSLKNRVCLESLLNHVIPVTSAFCGVHRNLSVTSPSTTSWTYDQILISRRSRFRAGTRFAKRGADAMGHVANYAETEQICVVYPDIHHNDSTAATLEVYSHVQVRGSIPLRWSSPTDITTYRPRVRIGTDPLAQARALWAHVVEQIQYYVTTRNESINSGGSTVTTVPQLVFCNLVDKKSDQGRLGRAFDAVLRAVLDVYKDFKVLSSTTTKDHGGIDSSTLPDPFSNIDEKVASTSDQHFESRLDARRLFLTPQTVQHVWFDFHAEVKGGKWDKLEGLLNQLTPTLLRQGIFAARLDGCQWTIAERQSGIIRTNCMDCLDRTNVVQSLIGRYILFRQLSKRRAALSSTLTSVKNKRRSLPVEYNSLFRRDPLKLPWAAGEMAHRLLWADNADVISRLYAGTAALKGDFTRTGKRTKRGALDDGMNSLQRYYLNNFLDADRQEGIDLMVGQAQFTTRPESFSHSATHLHDATDSPTTLKEAVRAMMLDIKTADESANDEKFHIRIKQSPEGKLRLRNRRSLSHPLVKKSRQPLLELRWLPGDLQDQMRSRVTSFHHSAFSISDDLLPSAAVRLQAMERRLETEIPWWVGTESDTDEESDTQASSPPGDFAPHAGHLVGALVVAFQAPLTTATLTVALLGILLEERSKWETTNE